MQSQPVVSNNVSISFHKIHFENHAMVGMVYLSKIQFLSNNQKRI